MSLVRMDDGLLDIVVGSLSQGNELSQHVLASVELGVSGGIRTYVPEGITSVALETGGILTTEVDYSEHRRRIVSDAMAVPHSIIIGENMVVRTSNSKLRAEIPTATSSFGEDIYEWMPGGADLGEFLNGLSNSWVLNCFLVDGPSDLPAVLEMYDVEQLAAKVNAVVVGAFDAEGFVLWSCQASKVGSA